MRRLGAACLAATTLLVAGCSGDPGGPGLPLPQEQRLDVDTGELRELRQEAGLDPCPQPSGEEGELPELSLPCVGGGPDVELSSLRGPMLISVWGSNCEECRIEMPVLQRFYETYRSRVPVLGVDFADTYPGKALEEMAARGATYPQVADSLAELLDHEEFAGIRGTPWLGVIDEQGRLTEQLLGGATSVEQVVDLVERGTDVRL